MIAHILTSYIQYVYKEGISTMGEIRKEEQYVGKADGGAKILLMGIPKAFGAINRTPLWEALYKKGAPEETIKHISRGHQGTRLSPKHNGKYGHPRGNDIGVFQGSAISAILFIMWMT